MTEGDGRQRRGPIRILILESGFSPNDSFIPRLRASRSRLNVDNRGEEFSLFPSRVIHQLWFQIKNHG